jgi:hypothetical protein
LLRVVEFGGATSFFPEDVVDVFKCLFKHGYSFTISQRWDNKS